ncbi:MAG TPA: hypothetical protein VJU77_07380 [Chthoniobacterales bacterium]|nr:hypothetical protein [Chthoniobacterales bacterium]
MLIVLPGPNGEMAVNISDFWQDQQDLGVRGWVSAEAGPPDGLEFIYDRNVVPVTSWHSRDDIAAKGPSAFRGKAGGLTFHSTHFAFPLHERPWDFWRYTDQALRVLFSPPLGFEVIRCHFDTPARMHPDRQREDLMHLPLEPVWVGHQHPGARSVRP